MPAPATDEAEFSNNCIQCIGLGYNYCGKTYHPFRYTACENDLDPNDCAPGKYATILEDCFDPVINPPQRAEYGIQTAEYYEDKRDAIMGGNCTRAIDLYDDFEMSELEHLVNG